MQLPGLVEFASHMPSSYNRQYIASPKSRLLICIAPSFGVL